MHTSLYLIEENQEYFLPERQKRRKNKEYAVVNSNLNLKLRNYSVLLTLIEIPRNIVISHQPHATMLLFNEFLKRLNNICGSPVAMY